MIQDSDLAHFFFFFSVCCCSAAQSCPTLCNPMDCQASLSLTISQVCPSSRPLHQRCLPAISSSDAFFSLCPQSFPASGSFPMSQLFASASASVLPMSVQDWLPLRLTGFISLLSKGFSGVFFSTTVWRYQIFSALPSLWSFWC